MKKTLTILILLISVSIFAEDNNTAATKEVNTTPNDIEDRKTSFSISSGTEYLDEFFFNFGFSIIKPLNGNKEIDIKCALNMTTQTNTNDEDDVEVTPVFNIPLKININFLFPINDKFLFLASTGLSPTIRLAGSDKGFLMGPNVKAGFRYKIHPSMSLFLEACQSLLIGPPNWMYPSTEVVLGVNFFM